MDPIALILTVVGIIIAIIFGYLQVIVPFTKKEVKFAKRFPFVISTTEVTLATTIDKNAYAKIIEREFPLPAERKPIAVLPFKNLTGETSYDYLTEAIPNLLITNLEQSKCLSVMTWERMHDLLKIMGKADIKIISEDLGFELCGMDGIDAVALGSFTKAGDMFATNVKVLDVETKKLIKSTSSKGKGVDSILKTQIDELSMHVAYGVGLSERKVKESELRVTEATTNSMDAYNYFLRGREDYMKYSFHDAMRFFEKAIELDSTFAMAYLGLAQAHWQLANDTARDENLKKALTYSKRVTEKEKLGIESIYAWFVKNDGEKAIHIYKEMAKKFPKDKGVYYTLGCYYSFKESYNEAVEEFNKALKLNPNLGDAMRWLAYLYAKIGDFEKAFEQLKRYAAVSPGHPSPFDAMGDVYLSMGELDTALAKYKEAIDVKPDFYDAHHSLAYVYALKEDYPKSLKWIDQHNVVAPSGGPKAYGHWWKGFYYFWLGGFEKSLSELDTAAKLYKAVGAEWEEASVDWTRAWVYYEKGEFELSLKYFKSYIDARIKQFPLNKSKYNARYNFFVRLVNLKKRHIDSSKSEWAKIKSLLTEKDTAYKRRAITLRDMYPLISCIMPHIRDGSARAYLKKGDLDKAIAEYERLITFDPKNQERRLIHPTYHYKLAVLYEEKGLKAKAVEQHEKFLNIWKNADADRPELIDAKKRLAKLKEIS